MALLTTLSAGQPMRPVSSRQRRVGIGRRPEKTLQPRLAISFATRMFACQVSCGLPPPSARKKRAVFAIESIAVSVDSRCLNCNFLLIFYPLWTMGVSSGQYGLHEKIRRCVAFKQWFHTIEPVTRLICIANESHCLFENSVPVKNSPRRYHVGVAQRKDQESVKLIQK